jgi:putative DNA primase/helicase
MTSQEINRAFEGAQPVAPLGQGFADDPAPGMDDFDMPPPSGLDEDCPEARAALYPLNDLGNGKRLIEYFGQDILFVPRLGWFRWEGKRWAADEDELLVRRDAQSVSGRILGEIEHIALDEWQREALDLWHQVRGELKELENVKEKTDEQKSRLLKLREIQAAGQMAEGVLRTAKKAHQQHSKSTGNSGKISNMLAEARVAAAVEVGALNSNPYMLNVDNGVVSFEKDESAHDRAWGQGKPKWQANLLPHGRQHMISKIVQAPYDKSARCDVFEAFLEKVQPDPRVRAFLKRWFGYTLTGLTGEQKLVFFYGVGRNGKSTLVDVIAKIVNDYGTTIPIETLTGSEQRKGSDATPDLVRLPGARFVRASEPDQGQRMKEALVKALTGGEGILIRRMAQEFVEIQPEFKLTISGNHRPEVRGSDDGIWRRILLVAFDEQIAEADVDHELPSKLWAERAGILRWMIEGCVEYLNEGLGIPDSVRAATEEYRAESDPLRTFLMDEKLCKITGSPDDFERSRDVVDAFNAFQLERDQPVWGRRTVSNGLKGRMGVVKGADGSVYSQSKRSDTGWLGLMLMPRAKELVAAYKDEISRAADRKG